MKKYTMGLTASSHMEKQMLCAESACTGCAACAAICSQNSITMRPDYEGFLRPVINLSLCTACNRCSHVCPILDSIPLDAECYSDTQPYPNKIVVGSDDSDTITYPLIYAAWHLDDDVRNKSSSGGVFTALANNILEQGGVVAGAAFDKEFVVHHILIDNVSELYRLRGSKYVQSEITKELLRQIRILLNQGRQVLFSGTPCEVAGLKSFLNQNYSNLFSCDLICHGVPSPLLFERYVKRSSRKGNELLSITFRDKTKGWKKYMGSKQMQNGKRIIYSNMADPYMASFLKDYALRPSCYECKFKKTERVGDLTIADFWGVKKKYPQYDIDDKGTSLIMVNNKKGEDWLMAFHSMLFLGIADLNTAIIGNPSLVKPCSRPSQRDTFYNDLLSLSFSKLILKYHLNLTFQDYMISFFKMIKKEILMQVNRINIFY